MKPFRFTIDHDVALDELRDYILETRPHGGILASVTLLEDGRWVVHGKWLDAPAVRAVAGALGRSIRTVPIPPMP